MQTRTFISLATLSLILGLGDFVAQPQPAGADSEAGLEAPMMVGRRRGRRGGYRRNQTDPQLKQQQKAAAQTLKADQKDASRRAKEVGRLKEKDIIHEYGNGKNTK
jgi:hypothetical protein